MSINIKLILVLFLVSSSLDGQNKRIYVAPGDHSDIQWSAELSTYNTAFLTMLDYYINLVDDTRNEEPNNQSRWNCDGSYWMWTYENNRTSAQFQKLIDYIKSGHISVPLSPIPVVWGATPAEAVIRAMYYPGKIERKYDLKFPLIHIVENQTLPLGLATLWKGAGAKYSWHGICQCATQVDATNRDHEIYWMTGLDSSKILMKWYSLLSASNHRRPGGYAEISDLVGSINYVDDSLGFTSRYPYPVIGLFQNAGDGLQTLVDYFPTYSKIESDASRTIIVSNEIDFFKDFESNYGDDISSVSLSFGNDWDLGSAAIQEISSRLKRATEKLRNTEAISTFASLADHSFLAGRENAKDSAWMNMGLFFDHNMGFSGTDIVDAATKRIAWQKLLVKDIESYINTLQDDAISVLGNKIIKKSSNSRYFVFNSLNWIRTDFTDLKYIPSGPVKVIDITTNLEVPSQTVIINNITYLRILARDVPAVGYKVYEVIASAGEKYSTAAIMAGNTIENSYYKVTVTPKGSISSIQSKKHGNQEFIKAINGKTANDLGGSVSGTVRIENSGPVSVTFVINSNSILNHTTRVTLFREIDRIDINNTINQNFTGTATWSFGFNVSGHTIRHEEVGTILKAKTKANGGHYADKNANYEWLTMNHFADVSNNSYGITLSNADCYFMKTGNSTLSFLDESVPQISVLSGGKINGIGLPNQGGDKLFTQRFALKTHAEYTPASAMTFSLEHQNPLVSGVISGGNFYPETSMSLFSIDNPDVILWSIKPSEEGIESGIIARLWNLSENSNSFTLGSYFQMLSAQNVTLIETPISSAEIQNNKISGQVNSFGFKTFNIKVNTENTNTLIVIPQSRSVSSISGSTSFTVSGNVDWNITDDATWLNASKTDASKIDVTYDENKSATVRTANIVVSGTGGVSQTVTVIQGIANAYLDVSPTSRSVNSGNGSTTFSVNTNVDWNVAGDAFWLTAAKTDPSTINVLYDENTLSAPRTSNILVSGTGAISKTVTLIQSGDSIPDTIPELEDFSVTLYPNPAKDFIILKFDTAIIPVILICLTDGIGRILYKNKFVGSGLNNEIPIDLSFLKSGLYFISIEIDKKVKIFKIIKEQ